MKRIITLLILCTSFSIILPAQLIHIKEEKPNTTGLHFLKKIVYQPLPGTETADKSKPSTTTYKTNQIIEYNEAGRIMSVMDYERGSEDVTNSTMRCYWEGRKLMKEVMENAKYEAVYTTTYIYNAAGNEMKSVTKSGPADQLKLAGNESIETIWIDGRISKTIRRNDKDVFKSSRTYTYDGKGMLIKVEYADNYSSSVKTYAYDVKGNNIKETDMDKDGDPSYIWERVYDQAGRVIKTTGTSYYRGQKQGVRIGTTAYDKYGGITSETDTDNGKTNTYTYKHTYDAKGNLIQTVSFKNGKIEDVEVRSLLYYTKKN